MKLPQWIRFKHEFDDAIVSVDLLARLLPQVEEEPLLWKWVIIAAHNALQGAMVCALSGSDGTGALSDASARQSLLWLETPEGPYPKQWMAEFPLLVERARSCELVRHGPPLKLSKEDVRDLDRLNGLRREAMHFTPKGWSIEAEGLPRIILLAVDGVECLMLRNERVVGLLDEDRQVHLAAALKKCRDLLKNVEPTPIIENAEQT